MENIQQPPPIEEPVQYAGFGKRFAAMMIDRVLIAMASNYMYWEIHREVLRVIERNKRFFERFIKDDGISGTYELADNYSYYLLALLLMLVTWCYYAGMESSPWRGTVGKKLLGLEVCNEDGDRISFTKATGRYFGKILSAMVFYIGYLSMLGNSKKQTWHDSMSGCIVKEK
jgi:uncharacterized RDD family membrane protein YckC